MMPVKEAAMNANQILFWQVFLTFCFFCIAIAYITHQVILHQRKKKVVKRTVKNKKGIKRKRRK